MKKMVGVIALLGILAALCIGCRAKRVEVTLLKDLNLELGVLRLYEYKDGETVEWSFFDVKQAQEIVDYINSRPVREMAEIDFTKLHFPAYGMRLRSGIEGENYKEFAWVDGFWLDSEGRAYQVDLEFEKIKEEYPWEHEQNFPAESFPCAYYLASYGGEWHPEFMSPGAEPGKNDLQLQVSHVDEESITVKMTNYGRDTIYFEKDFDIQVRLDGDWFTVPSKTTRPSYWTSSDGSILARTDKWVEHDRAPYGEWPYGRYRILNAGTSAEFVWEGNQPGVSD